MNVQTVGTRVQGFPWNWRGHRAPCRRGKGHLGVIRGLRLRSDGCSWNRSLRTIPWGLHSDNGERSSWPSSPMGATRRMFLEPFLGIVPCGLLLAENENLGILQRLQLRFDGVFLEPFLRTAPRGLLVIPGKQHPGVPKWVGHAGCPWNRSKNRFVCIVLTAGERGNLGGAVRRVFLQPFLETVFRVLEVVLPRGKGHLCVLHSMLYRTV